MDQKGLPRPCVYFVLASCIFCSPFSVWSYPWSSCGLSGERGAPVVGPTNLTFSAGQCRWTVDDVGSNPSGRDSISRNSAAHRRRGRHGGLDRGWDVPLQEKGGSSALVGGEKPLRIALVAPQTHAHLEIALTIGDSLRRRGHEVTLVSQTCSTFPPKIISLAESLNIPLSRDLGVCPTSATSEIRNRLSSVGALRSLLVIWKILDKMQVIHPIDFTDVLKKSNYDVALIDYRLPGAMTAAKLAGTKYVVNVVGQPSHYPPYLDQYAFTSYPPRLRDLPLGFRDRILAVWYWTVEFVMSRLWPLRYPDDAVERASIVNSLHGMEFNVPHLPNFFFVGPILRRSLLSKTTPSPDDEKKDPAHVAEKGTKSTTDSRRGAEAFSTSDWLTWVEEEGMPLIYVGFGTQLFLSRQNGGGEVLRGLMELRKRIGEVAVLWSIETSQKVELCRTMPGEEESPCDTWDHSLRFEPWVDQQLVLSNHAAIFLSHAGQNSIYDAIVAGVPMVLVPGYLDQLDNAARMRHYGVRSPGELAHVDAMRLADDLEKTLEDGADQKEKLRGVLGLVEMAGGVEKAADVVEFVGRFGDEMLRPLFHSRMIGGSFSFYMVDAFLFYILSATAIGYLAYRACCPCARRRHVPTETCVRPKASTDKVEYRVRVTPPADEPGRWKPRCR